MVRSRFVEDRLADAAVRKVKRYVMLGAGLETFPWRQPAFACDMQLFFLDHPATLAWTTARFRGRGLKAVQADAVGEPWLTRLRPADLVARLRCHGFGEVFHLSGGLALRLLDEIRSRAVFPIERSTRDCLHDRMRAILRRIEWLMLGPRRTRELGSREPQTRCCSARTPT